jgi:nitroreductase
MEALDLATARAAVDAAIRAPSMHNTQPWRFRVLSDGIEVIADRTRALTVADRRGWGARMACGAATYNLRLALDAMGWSTDLIWQPYRNHPETFALVTVTGRHEPADRAKQLAAAIPNRHSNRSPFWPEPVPAAARGELLAAAQAEGAWLSLLIGPLPVGIVGEIARSADRVLNRDEAYRAEVRAWSRTSPERADGVPEAAGGPSPQPHELFPRRPFGTTAVATETDEVEPLVGVLGTHGDLPVDQLIAGVALQRVLLTAADLGLATSLFSQPIEVPGARDQLRAALGRNGWPQIVVRIGYGEQSDATPRRPLEDVLETD